MSCACFSASNLKTVGFATALVAGVSVGCAVAAWGVQKVAAAAFAKQYPNRTTDEKGAHTLYSKCLGYAAVVAAAFAAFKFLPGSRCALSDFTNREYAAIAVIGAFIAGCTIKR